MVAKSIYIFAALLSFVLCALSSHILIPKLRRFAKQPIYEDGPSWHISKSGTPTMGGISFLIASTLTLVPCVLYLFRINASEASSLLCALIFSLLNATIGIIDDVTKLKRHQNAGLSPKQKLLFQFISVMAYLLLLSRIKEDITVIRVFVKDIDLGIFYYPLAAIIIVGIINFANLTDGIDGLAASVALSVSIGYAIIFGRYSESVLFISSAIIGITLAFLIFNLHPAKIFMGDTGSLFLGALLASAAFSTPAPICALVTNAVYIVEGLSVILQVAVYKSCGKRLFKMAPLHHHFEKCGLSENKICLIAVALTAVASAIALVLY